ncbi:substrate-binding domain-containing protein [Cohnella soli]|uniref:Substrate-binding domain-containing protein n=1 Tax=Cohnella soli TaxID=425005 RepID=A0ABW0HPS8_9BACL
MRKHPFTIGLIVALLSIAVYLGVYYRTFFGIFGSHGEKTVALIMKSSNVQLDFWQAVNNGAAAAAKEMGAELDALGPLTENDAESQMRILEETIARKPDAIVISPYNDERLDNLLAKARSAGIRLVVIDSLFRLDPSPVVVTNDYVEAGKLAGESAVAQTKGHPIVAVMSDEPESAASSERLKGLKKALESYKDSWYGVYYAQQSEERAYSMAKQLLEEGRPLNTFVAMDEPTTLGIAKLLQERRLEGVVRLIGFDSSASEVGLLESGTLDAAIVQKPFNMGYLGVKTALNLIDGKKVPQATYIESNVITMNNMYTAENQKLLFPFIGSNR